MCYVASQQVKTCRKISWKLLNGMQKIEMIQPSFRKSTISFFFFWIELPGPCTSSILRGIFFGLGLFITFDGWFVSGSYGRCLYLRLPVVSLRVPLKALCVDADGGTHSSTAATHSKHEARCIIEDDPQTLKWHKSNIFTIHFTVSILFCPLFALPLMDEQRWNKTNGLYDAIINRFVS